MKKLTLFVFMLFMLKSNAQQCGNELTNELPSYERSSSNPYVPTNNSLCINVAFRVVRNNDGTNGYDVTKIPQILSQLNLYFNPHNIYIKQLGTYNFVDNSNMNIGSFNGSINPVPNAINIYLVSNYVHAGQAFYPISIGFNTDTRVIIRKGALLNIDNTLAHEIGHCFNLRHTFHCSYTPPSLSGNDDPCYGFNSACAENPNGSNGNTHGDLVADTPADKYVTPNNCIPTSWNASLYNPNKKNIMSYWLNITKDHFTTGQGNRMRDAIQNAWYLQPFRIFDCNIEIKGPTRICRKRNQIGVYSVSGLTFTTPPTYNWSVTGKLQISGDSTNPTVSVSYYSAGSSSTPSTVSVTINGTITKTKTIKTNCVYGMFRISGVYDWISKDYGNMGLIIPIDPEDEEDPIVTYNWEITENPNNTTTNNEGTKPYFVGATANETNKFTSNSNQAIVNWGSSSNSYLITCNGVSASGEEYLINENYVEVGDPKNNPCFKDAVQSVIAPNPVRNGQVNVTVIKPENTTPCNYKDLEEPQFFNSDLDRVNNSITIFDYSGNEIYRNVFETNEFTIENLNLVSGNNYVVNLFTNEGGFRQQIIIAE